ncbi:MAG: hypothetical protein VX502_04745, partial [Candidatus Thermoplasmatota archaeon]|nr:hypothetical protein [Candidatus Thermoplasmatota archaeon]
MTEGQGDVAFAKTSSYEDHCEGNDWCLDRSEYRMLDPYFGMVPSHPVMLNPKQVSLEKAAVITDALLALNTDSVGQSILHSVLNSDGLATVD